MAWLKPLWPEEFSDYFGKDCSANVIVFGGQRYYVKAASDPTAARKDYLAHLLGCAFVNIPEAVAPSSNLRHALGLSECSHLIRLCQDYDRAALPIGDLTAAIAAEIAFSVWINRRDAHNSNRVYVGGVPMFFDFGAAFGLTAQESCDAFFRGGSDSGYVANWRLWEIPEDLAPNTITARDLERGKPLTLHPVHSVERFWSEVGRYEAAIMAVRACDIADAVQCCGFDPATSLELTRRLIGKQSTLSADLCRLRTIMTECDVTRDVSGLGAAATGAVADPVVKAKRAQAA